MTTLECLLSLNLDKWNEEKVNKFFDRNPNFDCNWRSYCYLDQPILVSACDENNVAAVKRLLAFPDIDVNAKDTEGYTAFTLSAVKGRLDCVKVLLEDKRVKLNNLDRQGYSTLCSTAFYGNAEVIIHWIASGRELYLGNKGDKRTDAIKGAETNLRGEFSAMEMKYKTVIALLLKAYINEPLLTQNKMRKLIGKPSIEAEFFAAIIFLCDGLLEFKEKEKGDSKAIKFFKIARILPMDIQLILCCRTMGSSKENIPGWERETAFKELASLFQ
jgi:hypothetical protein